MSPIGQLRISPRLPLRLQFPNQAPTTNFFITWKAGTPFHLHIRASKFLAVQQAPTNVALPAWMCSEIERDVGLLHEVQYLHKRTKLAIYCCNTRATHIARSLPFHMSEPRLSSLDSAFDSFMAHTLGFELDYDSGQHGPVYKAALAQLRA